MPEAAKADAAASWPLPRAALVVGGGPVGVAVARALAGEGYAVAIHDDDAAVAERDAAAVRDAGGRAGAITADGAETLLLRAEGAFGAVGVLVNNLTENRRLESSTAALQALMQAFAQRLPSGSGGIVVNVFGTVSGRPGADGAAAAVALAGLSALIRALALALAPRVRVVGIGVEYAAPLELSDHVVLRDVAAALRFLLGAPAVTGQVIMLAGHD